MLWDDSDRNYNPKASVPKKSGMLPNGTFKALKKLCMNLGNQHCCAINIAKGRLTYCQTKSLQPC